MELAARRMLDLRRPAALDRREPLRLQPLHSQYPPDLGKVLARLESLGNGGIDGLLENRSNSMQSVAYPMMTADR
jgi:hypothetical protein